tara:strand:+ start:2732 stop:3508 length:777 start_codon:yes stop_codon:yes gene_type:complete
MALLKFLGFGFLAISYFISTAPFYLYGKLNRYEARKYLCKIMQFHAKILLQIMGVKTKLSFSKPLSQYGQLIIGNHLSYIDVIVMAAHFPTCFVTSIEMKKTFFLGQLCEAGGCLYVERRSRENLTQEIEDITHALQNGLNVMVFPEATSTNGEAVKRFKRPLFQAAIDSGVDILPVIFNYISIDHRPVNALNRDQIFWYGEMKFLPHFWKLLQSTEITLKLEIAENINVSPEDNITELAAISHYVIKSHYQPVCVIS